MSFCDSPFAYDIISVKRHGDDFIVYFVDYPRGSRRVTDYRDKISKAVRIFAVQEVQMPMRVLPQP